VQLASLLVMENAVWRGRANNVESGGGLAHETRNAPCRRFLLRLCETLVLFWPRTLQPNLQVEFDLQVEFRVLML